MSMVHEITSQTPRNKRPMRKGRGRSAGKGKTCGKGTKGMKARTGPGERTGYEGGQTEIFRRFPKRGFSNVNFEKKFYVVNLSDLEKFEDGATVDAQALIAKGCVRDTRQPVKVLGNGELTKKLTVSVAAYSQSAMKKIAAAGGTVQDSAGGAVEVPAGESGETTAGSAADSAEDAPTESSVPTGGSAPDGKQAPAGVEPESGTRSADAPGAANVADAAPAGGDLEQE